MKAKYNDENNLTVKMTYDDGSYEIATVDGSIRADLTEKLNDFLAAGGIIEPFMTDAEIDAEEAQKKLAEAHQYLNDTDWYIVREQDTGKPTPPIVHQKREEARAYINAHK